MHPTPATPSATSVSSAVPPSALPSVPSVVNPSASPTAGEDLDSDPDPRTLTRREEAFTLYCHGYRSPAIASLLGIPQRTVRAWIASTLQATAEESRTRRDQQLRLAIESQRAIVQAAWHAFDRAARAERLTLEHLQNAVPLTLDDDDDPLSLADPLFSAPPSPPQRRGGQGVRTLPQLPHLPHLPTVGARYLQIVLHAQREIARLSGLYDLPASFYDPNAGRPMQIVIRKHPHLPPDQLLAWAAFREQWDADHPANPVPPEDLVFPPDGAPHHDFTPAGDDPDDPDGDAPLPDDDRLPPAHGLDAAPPDVIPPALHPASAPPYHIENAAETATPSPPCAAAADPSSLDFSPPTPCAGSSEPRSADLSTAIPPALLPHFRRRSGASPPQSLAHWNRGAP